MDALKAIIAKQKEHVTALPKAGPGRYFRQGDLEAQRRQQKQREEADAAAKKRSQELANLVELQERLKARKFQLSPAKQEEEATNAAAAGPSEEEQDPPIALTEVFRRLRKLKHPVTLFGETPWQRYCRLCALELQVLDDEMTEGQQNVFHALQREGEDDEEFEEEPKAQTGTSPETELTSTDANNDKEASTRKSKEDVIIEWTRRMLSLWEGELKQRSEEEKLTPDGRQQTALHRQTKKDLKPLLRKLKHRQLEGDICDRLHEIVQLCGERKYRDAHGAFMLLAIGNAAWPMGVTMVGIHERAGRSKLNTSQVAHILNDETTRKYIQMFKRLMSFCQRKFEANPSQTILLSVHHV